MIHNLDCMSVLKLLEEFSHNFQGLIRVPHCMSENVPLKSCGNGCGFVKWNSTILKFGIVINCILFV